jgi:hypothetical protein
MLIIIYLMPVFHGLLIWSEVFCDRMRAEGKLITTQAPCTPGYYCPSSSEAILCPLNSYCPGNVTASLSCPSGYITLSLGATSQDNCTGLFNLRGSYNTTSMYSIPIEGWCRFTDNQKNYIVTGLIILYIVIFCSRVVRYGFHKKTTSLFIKN